MFKTIAAPASIESILRPSDDKRVPQNAASFGMVKTTDVHEWAANHLGFRII